MLSSSFIFILISGVSHFVFKPQVQILGEDPEDNSYINSMSLPKARVWYGSDLELEQSYLLPVKLKNIYSFGKKVWTEGPGSLDLSDKRGLLD